MEAEVIRFNVPPGSPSHVLYIRGLPEDGNFNEVYELFVQFGAIYKLFHQPMQTFGLVHYFSTFAATKAFDESVHHRLLLRECVIKLARPTKTFHGSPGQRLAISNYINLANYYIGFGGWSSRIVKNAHAADIPDEGVPSRADPSLLYSCVLEITIPGAGSTEGIGWGYSLRQLNEEIDLNAPTSATSTQKYIPKPLPAPQDTQAKAVVGIKSNTFVASSQLLSPTVAAVTTAASNATSGTEKDDALEAQDEETNVRKAPTPEQIRLMKTVRAKRMAVLNAYRDAFDKLAIVLTQTGCVAVAIQPPLPDKKLNHTKK